MRVIPSYADSHLSVKSSPGMLREIQEFSRINFAVPVLITYGGRFTAIVHEIVERDPSDGLCQAISLLQLSRRKPQSLRLL